MRTIEHAAFRHWIGDATPCVSFQVIRANDHARRLGASEPPTITSARDLRAVRERPRPTPFQQARRPSPASRKAYIAAIEDARLRPPAVAALRHRLCARLRQRPRGSTARPPRERFKLELPDASEEPLRWPIGVQARQAGRAPLVLAVVAVVIVGRDRPGTSPNAPLTVEPEQAPPPTPSAVRLTPKPQGRPPRPGRADSHRPPGSRPRPTPYVTPGLAPRAAVRADPAGARRRRPPPPRRAQADLDQPLPQTFSTRAAMIYGGGRRRPARRACGPARPRPDRARPAGSSSPASSPRAKPTARRPQAARRRHRSGRLRRLHQRPAAGPCSPPAARSTRSRPRSSGRRRPPPPAPRAPAPGPPRRPPPAAVQQPAPVPAAPAPVAAAPAPAQKSTLPRRRSDRRRRPFCYVPRLSGP